MSDKLPALHFYVQDYLADTRSLSNELKGFYVDLLCYMHKSSRRGYLHQPSGNPYSLQQLSVMTGCSTDEASRLIAELLNSEVISATQQGVPFSRRMVRDEKKRLIGKKFGLKGGNPTLKGTHKGVGYPSPEDETEDKAVKEKGRSAEEGKRKSKPLFLPDSEPYLCALFFQKFHKDWARGAKPPDEHRLQAWASSFDAIMRIDNHTLTEINDMLNAIDLEKPGKTDFLWRNNILSPDKLRMQWNDGKLNKFIKEPEYAR